jgi:AraC-like DNA-binding protein
VLGFNDPAYFSRLFSTATGLSPRSFRDKGHKVA